MTVILEGLFTKKIALAVICAASLAAILLQAPKVVAKGRQTPAAVLQKANGAAVLVEGVQLRIGMTAAEVEKKLAGHEIEKDREIWVIGPTKPDANGVVHLTGILELTDGVVTFAGRDWEVSDDMTGAKSFYAAARSLEAEGFVRCRLSTKYDWLTLNCGEKSITMSTKPGFTKLKKPAPAVVMEYIGVSDIRKYAP